MKGFFVIAMICLFLLGCGQAARESGFYQHDTMYSDWDHLWFSWFGHKQVSPKEAKESKEEAWWGIPKGDQQKEKPDPGTDKSK